jgi:amino acid adenylation domain-containing protein
MASEIIEGFRLSPQQRHLWLLQRSTRNSVYQILGEVEVTGKLDTSVLKAALNAISRRHEILRTTFQPLPGMSVPVQVITDEVKVAWEEHDLAGRNANTQEQIIRDLRQEWQHLPWNFEQGPLCRVALITLSAEHHRLLMNLPALCADAESLKILVCEIREAYVAEFTGEEVAGEPMQFADLSEWQNERLEDAQAEIGRDHWRKHDWSTLLLQKLPLESSSVTTDDFVPRVFSLPLPAATAGRIDQLARQYETSVETFLLACWQVLIWRITGQPELVIGQITDARNYEALKGVVGRLARWLPVYCRLANEMSFVEVLGQADEAGREARRWQDYFLPEEIPGWGDDFPICYEYVGEQTGFEKDDGGPRFQLRWLFACTDRFTLKLFCREVVEGGLELELHYDASRFAEGDVERLGEQFVTLVESAVKLGGQVAVSRLEVVSESELALLVDQFNETEVDYGRAQCVHELIEAQVQRTPEAVALVYENERLSYAELNARANQLAHYLRRSGVGPESLVGILMERSVELVVGLLGVLKAGAAYVPLDPGYPVERLAYMMSDAGAAVVLTQERFSGVLPEPAARVICVDREWAEIARESDEEQESGAGPDNLAYVIYTSGSTGRPKGVMISHRSIANRLLWTKHTFSVNENDRILQKTPISFDASVWELFVPLMSGAQLIMARPGGHQDSNYLVKAIAHHGVTILQLVPSMLQVFLEENVSEADKSLRKVFCGGEAVPLKLQERFFALMTAGLQNLYGPTETSIDASSWCCERDSQLDFVPIGRPLGNIQIYLLDSYLKPVPTYAPGELFIGGVGLARGYHQRPELTAERFVPHPFSTRPGARLYRTGDLARYLPDGTIQFLGRIDHQVKVRGFRIELGEIETALTQHPGVREVVVVAREDRPGDKNLVAYVVASGDARPASVELRDFLKQHLPEYMVPANFVLLDTMPLTPNGKLDRAALPSPASINDQKKDFIAPRTAIEEQLARLWSELLNVERVSIDDNFFELGGHSLLATQLVSRLRESLQVELPLRSLFETPTIVSLAESIESRRGTMQTMQLQPPVKRALRVGDLPLSFAQQRLWFLHQLEPENTAYNISVGVRLSGQLNVEALERTLSEVIRRHEVLRTSFELSIDRQPVQVVREAQPIGLETIVIDEQLNDAEQEACVYEVLRGETQRPFDLTAGQMLNVRLIRLGPEEHVLLLLLHHIVSDAWSMAVLLKEVATLYPAFATGQPSPLDELPLQYADYAVWQREWLSGEVLERELQYWRRQLAGAPTQLELPVDRERPAVQTFRGAHHNFAVSSDVGTALKELGQQHGATLFMTLLAAFNVLLGFLSKRDDIVVGTNLANRNRKETEGLIGFFINQLVLRTDLSGNPTFTELLARVRETTLEGYAHQDVPFEKVVEAVRPERTLKYSPLFQVKIDLQNVPMPPLELPKLRLSLLEGKGAVSHFDITLYLTETDQGLTGLFEYNADLFDASTIARMAGHFEKLLNRIAFDHDLTLGELTAGLEEDERQHRLARETERKQANLQGLKSIKRRAVDA